ncbi:hypothetical protein MOBT1_000044 [Malassezia obtusa]|uniref:Uncharacterized protein n=1 Tax=Malassezia obtusa TaxID=76774 RepID=A0AAF0DWG3_9BASI|nr:hypothetical protein MOBT1_000044 [Malassezia obtusa]
MSLEAPRSGADAVPALEARASLDLQAARASHASDPSELSSPKTAHYWLETCASPNPPLTPSVLVEPASGPPSGSMHSRTTSNSFASWKSGETVLTGQTTPQQIPTMSSPLSQIRIAQGERPSHLDVSALSPQEYVQFGPWVERIKPAHSRRRGLLDEHAAVKFLRNEFGITVDDEVKIMSLFERLPLGLTPGHFFAMLRLASWAQQGRIIAKDLIFVQTVPPVPRRRRQHGPSRIGSASNELTRTASRHSPLFLPQPMLMDVPKAPPRQVPDDDVTARRRDALLDGDHEDEVSETRSSPRVVRPKPVVARPADGGEARLSSTHLPPPADDLSAARQPSRTSLRAPDSPGLLPPRLSLDRPSAPQPQPQVSPLIQASLNARSEMKKASRQASRPKTFTVLSSSSGQVERDKPRLLTGQEAPPHAQPLSQSKRRTQSINKMSSFLAQEARQNSGDANDGTSSVKYVSPAQTVAPKPSYVGRHHGILPAWLREQQEEGNVAYAPPDESSTPSVFEALDEKVHESMHGSEHAAASIDRNTPFFPPHKRDLDRVAQANLEGSGPAQYRALNAQTSAASDAGGTRMKLSNSRSKGALASKAPPAVPRRRVDPVWGTLLEAGTYAGFKSMPSARDLRLLTPRKELGSKRAPHYPMPPSQEFQPMLAPVPPAGAPAEAPGELSSDHHDSEESHEARRPSVEVPPRPEGVWSPKMQPNPRTSELQRFVLQGDATRPQLPHPIAHDRKSSGSQVTEFKPWPRHEPPAVERSASERSATARPASAPQSAEAHTDEPEARAEVPVPEPDAAEAPGATEPHDAPPPSAAEATAP